MSGMEINPSRISHSSTRELPQKAHVRSWWSIVGGLVVALALIPTMAEQLAKGSQEMIDQQTLELMSKLDSLDDRSRMQLLAHVDEQRSELCASLLKQLRTSSSKNIQAASIYLIGRHRFSEAAEELTRRIDFAPSTQPWIGSEPLWEKYPAMEALITIGLPSIPPTIELLATDSNDLRRSLAVKVVLHVQGPDVSGFILERAYAKERDPKRKANLQDAVSRLEQLIHPTK
jgi:hypothetical protein